MYVQCIIRVYQFSNKCFIEKRIRKMGADRSRGSDRTAARWCGPRDARNRQRSGRCGRPSRPRAPRRFWAQRSPGCSCRAEQQQRLQLQQKPQVPKLAAPTTSQRHPLRHLQRVEQLLCATAATGSSQAPECRLLRPAWRSRTLTRTRPTRTCRREQCAGATSSTDRMRSPICRCARNAGTAADASDLPRPLRWLRSQPQARPGVRLRQLCTLQMWIDGSTINRKKPR